MKFSRSFAIFAFTALAGCADHTAPVKPASLRIVAGDAQSGTVGQTLPTAPTFVVEDDRGAPLTGVAVTIAVTAGGGVVTAMPTKTAGAETRIGTWRLGARTGVNQLSVSVQGLPPLTITANAVAGPAAKIVATTPMNFTSRVGEVVQTPLAAVVTDSFDNPLAGAVVNVSATGGGTAPATLTADASGRVNVGNWTLGPIAGQQTLTLASGAATTTFIVTASPSDPARLVTVAGDEQRAFAGAIPTQPIVVRVFDRFGNGVPGVDATAVVTAGGGSVGTASLRSADDGAITISSWTLGKRVAPQALRITAAGLSTALSAAVQTDYKIDVRFYGPEMTDAQRALFTDAAARLSAIITGDEPDVRLTNLNVSAACGLFDLPTITETIDDVVIYASVRDIDGPRGILARAGPCLLRSAMFGYHTVIGAMEFDAADIALMAQQGTLQDVITHEMLHVIGVGTLWETRGLLSASGTPNVSYTGVEGTHGCSAAGGQVICAAGVPVENTGGPGTANAHWRETTFRNELMTGYVNLGGMPLSRITTGSLADLGYVTNHLAADPFQVPLGLPALGVTIGGEVWEQRILPMTILDEWGRAQLIRRP